MRSPEERSRGALPRAAWLAGAAVVAAALIVAVSVYSMRSRPTPSGPETVPPPPLPKPAPTTAVRPSTVVVPPAVKPVVEPAPMPTGPGVVFADDFSTGSAPGPKWVMTREGDFKEAVVDLVGGRLRLRAGTIGTRDDTVKHLGLRTADAVVDFSRPIEVGCEFDWNHQANGCYLRASLYLCPTATTGTAATERDWLCFEYVGVPPGKNARASLSRHKAGQLRLLYTEGWPDQQRTGRPVARERAVLRLGPETVELVENGKTLWGPAPHGLSFHRAWLYLELNSHSNYPPRELFFDQVFVRAAAR